MRPLHFLLGILCLLTIIRHFPDEVPRDLIFPPLFVPWRGRSCRGRGPACPCPEGTCASTHRGPAHPPPGTDSHSLCFPGFVEKALKEHNRHFVNPYLPNPFIIKKSISDFLQNFKTLMIASHRFQICKIICNM